MSDATWWYEWNGQPAGPVPESALLDLVRSGRLRPEARVWRAGMAGWEPLGRIPELVSALVPVRPAPAQEAPPPAPAPSSPAAPAGPSGAPPDEPEPAITAASSEAARAADVTPVTAEIAAAPAVEPAAEPVEAGEAPVAGSAAAADAGGEPARGDAPAAPAGSGAAPPSGGQAEPLATTPGGAGGSSTWAAPASGTLPPGMEPTSTGAVIGLGLVTLGIYPMIKFYRAATAYEQLAGRRSRFAVYFWLSVGLALAGGPLHAAGGALGFAANVAAIVFTVLTLFEALSLRAELVRRQGIAPPLTPDSTHKVLFIVGLLTAWFLLGVVLLLIQAVKFFQDHRAIGDALRARGTGASPPPAAAQPTW